MGEKITAGMFGFTVGSVAALGLLAANGYHRAHDEGGFTLQPGESVTVQIPTGGAEPACSMDVTVSIGTMRLAWPSRPSEGVLCQSADGVNAVREWLHTIR